MGVGGGHGAKSTAITSVGLCGGLEGFAGKAVAQADCLKPRPLAENGKCRAAGKASKPEGFGFALNFRLTVATPKTLSRTRKTSTLLKISESTIRDGAF